MTGPEIVTLGCRLNFAESEAMRALTADRDDIVIVNSCAVTAEAVRKTRQEIRKAKRARPGAEVLVTGCAAQIEPGMFLAMPEVARVIGNREKFEAASFARPSPRLRGEGNASVASEGEGLSRSHDCPSPRPSPHEWGEGARALVSDIMAVRETAPHLASGFADRARAFVEVQNGCDHRCTFCVIPYGRGNSRSVPAGLVVDRIAALVDQGFAEIVLTGVDLTSYGPDLPGSPRLGQLVERILRHVPALPRLRLSSLDSVEIDDRLFELLTGEPRMMPHLHLSLQAGDDMILKRMKRRHSRADAVRIVERLKKARAEIAIGADLIAGFPTESDAMGANSLALIDDCDIVFGHVFPYSERAGTPAARMPQLPVAIRKARAEALRAAAARRKGAWLKTLVGAEQRVLIERADGRGHAENFAEVVVAPSRHPRESGDPSPACATKRPSEMDSRFRGNDDVGKVVNARITAARDSLLLAVPA